MQKEYKSQNMEGVHEYILFMDLTLSVFMHRWTHVASIPNKGAVGN